MFERSELVVAEASDEDVAHVDELGIDVSGRGRSAAQRERGLQLRVVAEVKGAHRGDDTPAAGAKGDALDQFEEHA